MTSRLEHDKSQNHENNAEPKDTETQSALAPQNDLRLMTGYL
jgi:hypothetical protein